MQAGSRESCLNLWHVSSGTVADKHSLTHPLSCARHKLSGLAARETLSLGAGLGSEAAPTRSVWSRPWPCTPPSCPPKRTHHWKPSCSSLIRELLGKKNPRMAGGALPLEGGSSFQFPPSAAPALSDMPRTGRGPGPCCCKATAVTAWCQLPWGKPGKAQQVTPFLEKLLSLNAFI